MTPILGAASADAPDISNAARAAEAVADGLNARGLDVCDPASAQSCYLKVTNVRDTLADLIISPGGVIDWEYRRYQDGPHDPAQMTAIVMALLTGDDAPAGSVPVTASPHLTLKGAVGRAAADQGMRVTLEVLDWDEVFFEIYAEITVTNPARPDHGTVRVTDDGAIWWRCSLFRPARQGRRPRRRGDRPDNRPSPHPARKPPDAKNATHPTEHHRALIALAS